MSVCDGLGDVVHEPVPLTCRFVSTVGGVVETGAMKLPKPVPRNYRYWPALRDSFAPGKTAATKL